MIVARVVKQARRMPVGRAPARGGAAPRASLGGGRRAASETGDEARQRLLAMSLHDHGVILSGISFTVRLEREIIYTFGLRLRRDHIYYGVHKTNQIRTGLVLRDVSHIRRRTWKDECLKRRLHVVIIARALVTATPPAPATMSSVQQFGREEPPSSIIRIPE
jgi:hypothetical protein